MGLRRRSHALVALSTLALASSALAIAAPSPASAVVDPANAVIINEVYGGGGNVGSTTNRDFIELFNVSAADVVLDGWSVQYASANGATWAVTPLTGSIKAGDALARRRGSRGQCRRPARAACRCVRHDRDERHERQGRARQQHHSVDVRHGLCRARSGPGLRRVRHGQRLGRRPGSGAQQLDVGLARTQRTATRRTTASTSPPVSRRHRRPLRHPAAATTTARRRHADRRDPGHRSRLPPGRSDRDDPRRGHGRVPRRWVPRLLHPDAGHRWFHRLDGSHGIRRAVRLLRRHRGRGGPRPVRAGHGRRSRVRRPHRDDGHAADDLTVLDEAFVPPAPVSIAWPTTDALARRSSRCCSSPLAATRSPTRSPRTSSAKSVWRSATSHSCSRTDIADAGCAGHRHRHRQRGRAVTLDDGATTNFLSAANQGAHAAVHLAHRSGACRGAATFNAPVVVDFRNNIWKLQPTDHRDVARRPPSARRSEQPHAAPDAALLGAAGEGRVLQRPQLLHHARRRRCRLHAVQRPRPATASP